MNFLANSLGYIAIHLLKWFNIHPTLQLPLPLSTFSLVYGQTSFYSLFFFLFLHHSFYFFNYLIIYLFIYGCVGSLFLCEGFL